MSFVRLLWHYQALLRYQVLGLANLVSAKQSNSRRKDPCTNGNQAKSGPAVAAAPHLGPSPTQGGSQRTRTAAEDALPPRFPGPPGSLPCLQASGSGPSVEPLRHRTPAPPAAATHFTEGVDRSAVNGRAPGNTAMATVHANRGL